VARAVGAAAKKASREEAFGTTGRGGARYCSLTIVFTLAVTPSAISTTTM
jgi:hypothetical protein